MKIRTILIATLLLITPSAVLAELEATTEIECMDGRLVIFPKQKVDSFTLTDGVVEIIQHKDKTLIVNAACVIKHRLM